MNNRTYWERVGASYDAEVFDVSAADSAGVIASRVERFSNRSLEAADFGCGIGNFLPLLSQSFRGVQALDFSKSCLRDGARRFVHLENVSFRHFDMCRSTRAFAPVDFVFSVNALLTPDYGRQLAMFKTLARHVVSGGRLLLVVPAVESAMFVVDRYLQWNVRSGMSPRTAMKAARSRTRTQELEIKPHGVVEIDGAATKHYLREELIDRLTAVGFAVDEIVKVEYDWKSEFNRPPRWMKAPYPWDWCVSATRG